VTVGDQQSKKKIGAHGAGGENVAVRPVHFPQGTEDHGIADSNEGICAALGQAVQNLLQYTAQNKALLTE
jgi:hypothetical protein